MISILELIHFIDGPSYVLKDWPTGYRMFDHNKGHQSAPRHDFYLMGKTARLLRRTLCFHSSCLALFI